MLAMFMFGGVLGVFALLFLATLAVLSCVFWIWMLIDAIQNPGLGDGEKVGWVLGFFHLLPAALLGRIALFYISHPKRLMPASGPEAGMKRNLCRSLL